MFKSTKDRHLSSPKRSLFYTGGCTQIPILFHLMHASDVLSLFSKRKNKQMHILPLCKYFLTSLPFIKSIIIKIITEQLSIYFKSDLWNKVKMNLALTFNHRVLGIPKQRKGFTTPILSHTDPEILSYKWICWPRWNLLIWVGADGGPGILLDIGVKWSRSPNKSPTS